jgi:hypothetical protein
MKTILIAPKALEVISPDGGVNYGGSQEWYTTVRQQRSGCGPTVASGIMWYWSDMEFQHRGLWFRENRDNTQASFLKLMEIMFTYVTPGRGGVSTTAVFADGVRRYGADSNVPLQTRTLEIPTFRKLRPSVEALGDFLSNAIKRSCPVAFLNLSSGALKNLDSWHWVLIIGVNPDSMTATICDQGRFWDIDIGKWLRTSVLGGGMVVVN